jgi:cell division transport system permease protein
MTGSWCATSARPATRSPTEVVRIRVRFFIVEAFRSIRSNLAISAAAMVTVLIAVFILGAFIPSFLYVQSAVNNQKQRVDARFFLSDFATPKQKSRLWNRIQRDPRIVSATYTSKDQAVAELKKRLKDPSILKEVPGNPLPASFDVKPKDPEHAEEIITTYARDPALDKEQPYSYGRETANRLLSVARFIQWSGLVLITILMVAAVLLIGNTIRLSIFARRREVEVMKLVGATNWFIRWPFVIEGIICGIVGAVLSALVLWAVKVGVVDGWLEANDTALTRDEATTIGFFWLAVVLVAAGALVGAVGSGITLRRFLKV